MALGVFPFGMSVYAGQPCPPSLQGQGFSVIYVGGSLGYLRSPDHQSIANPQPPDSPSSAAIQAEHLIQALCGPDKQLVVSMGNQFAPQITSRVLYPRAPQPGTPLPPGLLYKDENVWQYLDLAQPTWVPYSLDIPPPPAPLPPQPLTPQLREDLIRSLAAGNGELGFDNVAQFLREAGFDALVPGVDEFYYGPERLREIGRLLALPAGPVPGAPRSQTIQTGHPVRLLASNLVITTSVDDQMPRLPSEYQPDRGFAREHPVMSLDLPSTILPTLREFTVSHGYTISQMPPPSGGTPQRLRVANREDDIKVTNARPGGALGCTLVDASDGRIFNLCPLFLDVFLVENPRTYAPGSSHNPDELAPAAPIPLAPKAPKTLSENVTLQLPAGSSLDPDHNYHLCLDLATPIQYRNKSYTRYCEPFSVSAPFLSYHHLTTPAVTPPDFEWPIPNLPPWLVKPVTFGPKTVSVAVFGVVDPDLPKSVGLVNYSWLNDDKAWTIFPFHKTKYDTKVDAVDPKLALDQDLQTCAIDTVCNKARKVLLAQMSPAKARALASQYAGTFDLVVAQADALQHTSTEQIQSAPVPVTNSGAPGRLDQEAAHFPFVVVPDVHSTPRDQYIEVRLQRAVVYLDRCKGDDCSTPVRLVNDVAACQGKLDGTANPPCFPPAGAEAALPAAVGPLAIPGVPLKTNPSSDCVGKPSLERPLYCLLLTTMSMDPAVLDPTNPNPLNPHWMGMTIDQVVSDAAMAAMNHQFHTDLATLQKRDLYDAVRLSSTSVTPGEVQTRLDQIFWKGDFVINKRLTGATIKAVMAQSKKFDQEDSNSVADDHAKNRSLVQLGMFKNQDLNQFVIGGDPLNDNNLYGVAMTDFLAFGDTGYADLQKPAIPPPDRLSTLGHLYRLSGILCGRIRDMVGGPYAAATCHVQDMSAEEYFDQTDHPPFDNTPGMNAVRNTLEWLYPRLQNRTFHDVHDPAEKNTQQLPHLSIVLEKADFGYTFNQHNNGTEANLQSRFEGVPVAPVSAVEAATLTADWRIWLRETRPRYQFFMMSEMNYANTAARVAATNAYSPAQTANLLAGETGMMWRLKPWNLKRSGSLFFLTSARAESQFGRPVANLNVFAPPLLSSLGPLSNPFTLTEKTNRSEGLYGKIGLRYEDPKSWIEGGYQPGLVFNSPVGYSFSTGQQCYAYQAEAANGATPLQQSLYNCMNNQSVNPPPLVGTPTDINSNATFTSIKSTLYQPGYFLNFHASVPLPVRLFRNNDWLIIDNRANYYMRHEGDVSLETRYFVDWSVSLVVPLIGNLSVSPKIEWFWFQNKVDQHEFTGYQATFNFTYWFQWHRGLGARALLYPYPQPNP
jgi:hypothetical protein